MPILSVFLLLAFAVINWAAVAPASCYVQSILATTPSQRQFERVKHVLLKKLICAAKLFGKATILHLLLAFVMFISLDLTNPSAESFDIRFKVDELASGMAKPMELEIAPDGRIFFNEIYGELKIYKPDIKKVVTAGKLQVFTAQENGFLT